MARPQKIAGGLPEVTEVFTDGSDAPKLRPNDPAFHGDGRYGAPANPTAPQAAKPPPAPTKTTGWFRRAAEAAGAPTTLRGGAEKVGNMAGKASRVLGPAVGAASVVSNFNDFKIDDPDTDSSAAGTVNALRSGDFQGAFRGAGKGLLETGMDLGSTAADAVDTLLPGRPAGTAYRKMLRGAFGDQLIDNSGFKPPAPPVAAAAPTPSAPAPAAQPFSDARFDAQRAPVATAAAPTLRQMDTPNVSTVGSIGVEGYNRQLANMQALPAAGPESGSGGIRDSGRDKWNANFDRDVLMSRLESASRLGTGGTRRDALRALAEVGKMPTPFEAQEVERNRLAVQTQQNTQALRIAEMNNATSRRNNDQNNATSLRGQDVTLEGQLIPARTAEANRRRIAAAVGGEGGSADLVGGAQRLAAAGDLVGANTLTNQASSIQALSAAGDAQARAREKDTAELFRPQFTTPDKDGRPTFDEVGAAQAAAVLRQVYPTYDQLSPTQKRAAEQDALARAKNMAAEQRPSKGLVDSALDLVGLYDQPPMNTGPVDLRGATLSRAGLFSAPGINRNAIQATLPDGKTYTYGADGNITDEQIRQLEARRLRAN